MRVTSAIHVEQPIGKVWEFCQDIPRVASCLPGAEITEEISPDHFAGKVQISMGPVKMKFSGTAEVIERDEANKKIVIDATGADETGQEQARLDLAVQLESSGSGTNMDVTQDIHLSGAAAQYGRGMISDVTQILMRDFATNVHNQLDAIDRGVAAHELQGAQSASGFAIGIRAAWMALKRVAARFFLPYEPTRT